MLRRTASDENDETLTFEGYEVFRRGKRYVGIRRLSRRDRGNFQEGKMERRWDDGFLYVIDVG